MNRFRNLIAIFAFSLLILGLPSLASAQWGNNRNDDYGNNNRNNNRNYNRNLQATVKNLKNNSRQFERRVDRELDNSRYDGKKREDRILQLAQQFKDAAETLDNSYDNRRDYNNSRDEAQRVLQLGSQLDRVISRSRLNVSNDFNGIRQDLRVLANAYNTNYNNRNGNNRNNRRNNDGYYDGDDDDDYNRDNRNNRRTNNNGDWRSKIPFPLPF